MYQPICRPRPPIVHMIRLVTSFQERQRHWQFALQFLFAALHGQQPWLLFRAQAPLHGQETSTNPRSYWPRMANLMNGWKRGGSTFSPSSKYSQGFSCSSLEQPIHKRLLPRNLQNQWIHLIPCRIKTYRTVLNRIILTSSLLSSEKTQKVFWDNVTR